MSDILEDIWGLMDWHKAHSILQKIWFIDRTREFFTLLDAMPAYNESNPYSLTAPTLGGVPVQRWTSQAIRAYMAALLNIYGWSLERLRRDFPFCQPGIWFQMSNGQHQHIELERPT